VYQWKRQRRLCGLNRPWGRDGFDAQTGGQKNSARGREGRAGRVGGEGVRNDQSQTTVFYVFQVGLSLVGTQGQSHFDSVLAF